MKKYLIFIGSLKKGGAERNAALLANHLISQGHRVKLVMLVDEIKFYLDPLVEKVVLSYEKSNSSGKNFFTIYRSLRAEVKKFAPHKLITLSRIAGLFAASLGQPNTIVRFDIYPLIGYKGYKKLQFWILYNLPWVKYVVCPSNELMEDVRPYFLNKHKLVVIPNPKISDHAPSVTAYETNGNTPRPSVDYISKKTRMR